MTKLQEVTVIDLLKDGDRVTGAIALDENGSIVVLKADSTVLATGGGSRVYDVSTNSSSGTGDGFAMGTGLVRNSSIWKWSSSTRPARCTRTMHRAGPSRKPSGAKGAC